MIDNWDAYKQRDSQLMEDLTDAAGDRREQFLLAVEAVGDEILQRVSHLLFLLTTRPGNMVGVSRLLLKRCIL